MDKIKEKISEVLPRLIEFVEKTAATAGEQVPLFIQELLSYSLWSQVLGICVTLTILIAGIWAMRYSYKVAGKIDDDSSEFGFMVVIVIIAFFAAVISFITIIIQADEMVKIVLAPRVYILDYLRSL